MADNEYYERLSEMNPGELADGLAMEAEFDAISLAFAMLPIPHTGGQGFGEPVRVSDAVNPDEAVSLGQLNAAIGEAKLLPIATYGNLNAVAWGALASGDYLLFGTGAQFSNFPATLVAGSTYFVHVRHVIGGAGVSLYGDKLTFASVDDVSNVDINREFSRLGSTLAAANTAGWMSFALKKGGITPLEALTPAADRIAYYTGAATAALATLTPFARTLLDDADAAAARATLGVPSTEYTDSVGSAAIKDAHRHAVESASGGRNTVLYDAQGHANVMVVIPRFNCEDLGLAAQNLGTGPHPAFIVNGAPKSEIFIGKYLASQAAGGCASVAGAAPYTSIDQPEAEALCKAKGAGWHLFSAHEWGAIQLWCLANSKQPRGNTNYGRAHDAKWEVARRVDGGLPGDVAGVAATLTGQGPVSWTHDGTPDGICDLTGNVWEWLSLLRLVDGRFMVSPDNNYALTPAQLPGIAAYLNSISSQSTGGNISVGAMQLAASIVNRTGPAGNDSYDYPYNHITTISTLAAAGGYVSNQLLRRLGIEQCAAAGAIWSRNYGTRAPLRGGTWHHGADAGLGALHLYVAPSNRNSNIGFRPAFVSP